MDVYTYGILLHEMKALSATRSWMVLLSWNNFSVHKALQLHVFCSLIVAPSINTSDKDLPFELGALASRSYQPWHLWCLPRDSFLSERDGFSSRLKGFRLFWKIVLLESIYLISLISF